MPARGPDALFDRTGLVLGAGWRAAIADDALRRAYPDLGFDDESWEPAVVPSHWRSTPAFAQTDGPLLYRNRFECGGRADSSPAYRYWLVLDGVFYTSDVWLDGTYLGDTEGYFFPHQFDATAQISSQSEHVLALEVACSPQTDRARKRNLTGVFQHWDLIDQSWNPGGIWRPVRIERSGPVRIKFFRVCCRDVSDASATVFVRAVLDAAEPCSAHFVSTIGPSGSASEGLDFRERRTLAAGENRVEWTLTVPSPRLWWPWSLGDQPLYDLTVDVELDGQLIGSEDLNRSTDVTTHEPFVSDRRQCRLGLRHVTVENWIFTVNGERLFLKGANQGPTRMALAEASADDLRRDVELARDTGLDLLRVHGHISRPELYDAADEVGMLLWQDLPLQWGYSRAVRRQARRQAREAVDLLAHHPSVLVWCGHNEPFAIATEPSAVAEVAGRRRMALKGVLSSILPTWNKTVLDYSIKRVLEKTDGSRPVIAHSGVLPHPPLLDGTDSHLYFGWYHGNYRDFAVAMAAWPRLARFVSEFGAQAVPSEADFLHPERWPDLDWQEAHQRYSLQRAFFERYVPPHRFATFTAWAEATQRYQADLLRFHIETLRRLKYAPTGGFALFCFADGYPSVTPSLLDHERRPKAAYDAVRSACEPVIVVADWFPADPHPGQAIALDIHIVNDRHVALSDMNASAHLSWKGLELAPDQTGDHRWHWQGDVPADAVVRVGTIQFVLPRHPAAVQLDLALRGPGLDITNHYETVVDQHGSTAESVRPRAGAPVAPLGN